MNKKIRNIIMVVAVGLLMAEGIHYTQEFRFYHLESNWLFLYDWADVWSRLKMTGGLALVVSSFLTQFFRIPLVGAAVTALVYLACSWLIYKVLSRKVPGPAIAGLSLLPAVFMFLCLENDYYCYHAHIALLMNLAALYGYVSMRPTIYRTLCGAAAVIFLYQMTGSAALVFTVCALIWDIDERGVKGLAALVYPAIFISMAWLLIRAGRVDSWEEALTPFMYYSRPSTYFFPIYAWTSVLLLLLVAVILNRLRFSPSKGMLYALAGCTIAFLVAGNLYGKVHSRMTYRMIQEQYWAENEEWDKIISTADRRQPTYLVSYLNLALAHKGMLVQNFGYYNPQDLSSIMCPIPNLKIGLSMQSCVYSAWDYHAAARQAAFDANTVTSGNSNPRQLQVLIKTNIDLGAYDVARKYMSILRKTLFYRGMAEELYKTMKESEIALHQLPDEYVRYEGLEGDMRDILEINPSHPVLSQFYMLYQILEEGEK